VVQPNPTYQMTLPPGNGAQVHYEEIKTSTLQVDNGLAVIEDDVNADYDSVDESDCGSDYVPVDQSEYDFVTEPTYEEIPGDKL